MSRICDVTHYQRVSPTGSSRTEKILLERGEFLVLLRVFHALLRALLAPVRRVSIRVLVVRLKQHLLVYRSRKTILSASAFMQQSTCNRYVGVNIGADRSCSSSETTRLRLRIDREQTEARCDLLYLSPDNNYTTSKRLQVSETDRAAAEQVSKNERAPRLDSR